MTSSAPAPVVAAESAPPPQQPPPAAAQPEKDEEMLPVEAEAAAEAEAEAEGARAVPSSASDATGGSSVSLHIFGIDFGTTAVYVAHQEVAAETAPAADAPSPSQSAPTPMPPPPRSPSPGAVGAGLPVAVRDCFGNEAFPAVISLARTPAVGGGEAADDDPASFFRLFGEEALARTVSAPQDTVANIRRLLARADDWSACVRLAPAEDDGDAGAARVELAAGSFSPVELAAMVLEQVELSSVRPLAGSTAPPAVAVSVPGTFGAAARGALVNACTAAGLRVRALVPDCTAAALAYAAARGTSDEGPRLLLFVLMGHSHFSAEVVRLAPGRVDVVAAVHDSDIGAHVFDVALYDRALRLSGLDAAAVAARPRAHARLVREARKTKEILSTLPETALILEGLAGDTDLRIKLSRSVFSEDPRTAALLAGVEARIAEVLAASAAALGTDGPVELAGVEGVGGGLRIPCVQEHVARAAGVAEVGFHLDSSTCVAVGAAVALRCLPGGTDAHAPGGLLAISDAALDVAPAPTVGEADLAALGETLRRWRARDELERERRAVQNALEDFLFRTRGRLESPAYADVLPADAKQAVEALLAEASRWLDDEASDAARDALLRRLEELEAAVAEAAPLLQVRLAEEWSEREHAAAADAEARRELEAAAAAAPLESRRLREPLTKTHKLEAAKMRKEQGNVLFQREGDFDGALVRYTQAVNLLVELQAGTGASWALTEEEKAEIVALSLSCYLNLGAVCLKVGKYDRARENCIKALQIDPKSVKAMYRRGMAQYYLRQFEDAQTWLKKGQAVDPGNAEIRRALRAVAEAMRQESAKEKRMYSRMFGA